jgi:hypothetical protein
MTRRRTPPIDVRRRVPAGLVLVTGMVALGLATLLNAGSLLETAERQPVGTARSLAVGIMEPIAGFSDLVRLDTPRELFEQAIGRETDRPEPAPDDPADDPVVLRPIDSNDPETTTTTVAATTSTTRAPATVATPTPEDPMFLWIIGDSFMELFGPALQNDAFETGVVESEVDFRFVSGLVRSDFFDWPAHIRTRMPELQPDAVVAMFGGNDGQPIVHDGTTLEPDTPEWLEVYADLVGEAMDEILAGGAARVYWIGLPIMRDDEFTQRVIGFNEVYRAEAAERPEVVYVSSFELFQDRNGEYATYLRTEGGDLLEMRFPDGAHFTWPGSYRLSDHVLGIIAEDWGFTDRLG